MLDRSNVLLLGVVGSTAYGLAREGSDRDRLGVYAAPKDVVLGLNGSSRVDDPTAAQSVDDTLVEHDPDPDLTLHEVGKYVSLALIANPTVLELMFLPALEVLTRAGNELVLNRHLFLSEKYIKARYGGYARSQLNRLLTRQGEGKEGFSSDVKNRTEKHGRHCARLAMQAIQILRTGDLTVNVGDQRELLFDMGKRAAQDPQFFEVSMLSILDQLDNIETRLPYEPDYEAVNKLLVRLREASWV